MDSRTLRQSAKRVFCALYRCRASSTTNMAMRLARQQRSQEHCEGKETRRQQCPGAVRYMRSLSGLVLTTAAPCCRLSAPDLTISTNITTTRIWAWYGMRRSNSGRCAVDVGLLCPGPILRCCEVKHQRFSFISFAQSLLIVSLTVT